MTDAPAWPGEPGFPLNLDELAKRLRHAATTAQNDDESPPGSEKRARHIARFEVMIEVAEALPEVAQREREAELRGWEQAISFLDDKCGEERWILDCMLAELARRRAEAQS